MLAKKAETRRFLRRNVSEFVRQPHCCRRATDHYVTKNTLKTPTVSSFTRAPQTVVHAHMLITSVVIINFVDLTSSVIITLITMCLLWALVNILRLCSTSDRLHLLLCSLSSCQTCRNNINLRFLGPDTLLNPLSQLAMTFKHVKYLDSLFVVFHIHCIFF